MMTYDTSFWELVAEEFRVAVEFDHKSIHSYFRPNSYEASARKVQEYIEDRQNLRVNYECIHTLQGGEFFHVTTVEDLTREKMQEELDDISNRIYNNPDYCSERDYDRAKFLQKELEVYENPSS